MVYRVILFIVIGLFLLVLVFDAKDSDKDEFIISEVQKWLIMRDEGKYADCWEALTESLQKKYGSQEQWALGNLRKDLEKLLSRELKSITHKRWALDAPLFGKKYYLEFNSSFENMKYTSVTERVQVVLDGDDGWKIFGLGFGTRIE